MDFTCDLGLYLHLPHRDVRNLAQNRGASLLAREVNNRLAEISWVVGYTSLIWHRQYLRGGKSKKALDGAAPVH